MKSSKDSVKFPFPYHSALAELPTKGVSHEISKTDSLCCNHRLASGLDLCSRNLKGVGSSKGACKGRGGSAATTAKNARHARHDGPDSKEVSHRHVWIDGICYSRGSARNPRRTKRVKNRRLDNPSERRTSLFP